MQYLALAAPAHAEDIVDALTVAWESFWHQSGFPRAVQKWSGPVRVTFSGAEVARHREVPESDLSDALIRQYTNAI